MTWCKRKNRRRWMDWALPVAAICLQALLLFIAYLLVLSSGSSVI